MSLNQVNPRVYLVMREPSAPYWLGVMRFAREAGWNVRMGFDVSGTLHEVSTPDGLITDGSGESGSSDTACPRVVLNAKATPTSEYQVCFNEATIGGWAADHLIVQGCRHFASVADVALHSRASRIHSFEQRLLELGHSYVQLSSRSLRTDLRGLPKGTGIFAFDDRIAVETIQTALDAGLRVPGDLSVVGVNDDPILGGLTAIPLTSIQLPFEDLGYAGARLLSDRMAGRFLITREQWVEPLALVPRSSTQSKAVCQGWVKEALAHILVNYTCSQLSVSSVSDSLGISRRSLERVFRREVGTTVSVLITTLRVNEAARRLRCQRHSKVSDIARAVGFNSNTHFSRCFRRHFGTTPKLYTQSRLAPPPREESDGHVTFNSAVASFVRDFQTSDRLPFSLAN